MHRPAVAATIASLAIGLVLGNAMPLVLGTLVDSSGISPSTAGNLIALEFGIMAIISLALAPRVARLPMRWLGLGGGLLAGLAQAASGALLPLTDGDFGLFLGLRALTGVGAGLLIAAANAALTQSTHPARHYGAAGFAAAGISALYLAGLPPLLAAFPAAPYIALAAVMILPLTLVRHLPLAGTFVAPGEATPHVQSLPSFIEPTAVAVLLAVFCFSLALGALWPFSDLIGVRIGLSRELTGQILGLNLLCGLAGGAAAASLAERRGVVGPWLLGCIVLTGVALGLGGARTATHFIAAQLVYGFFYTFTLPYLMAVAARLDASGRCVTAAGGVFLLGTALGPAAGGALTEAGGIAWLGSGVALAMSSAALILIVLLLHRRVQPVHTA